MIQHTVISLLIAKSVEVVKNEDVYDVDSHNSGTLSNLSPAIFHNMIFYIEVFCKAYLNLSGFQVERGHKLQVIYQKTVEAVNRNQHDDSLFQILVLEPLYRFVYHITRIPGNFKEQFIKYDDNPSDDTVVLFELSLLNEILVLLELSCDFIWDYFYMGAETHYLKTNVYQRMLDRADTDEKKDRIRALYPHLESKSIPQIELDGGNRPELEYILVQNEIDDTGHPGQPHRPPESERPRISRAAP